MNTEVAKVLVEISALRERKLTPVEFASLLLMHDAIYREKGETVLTFVSLLLTVNADPAARDQ